MTKVFILIHAFEYEEDGFEIKGVFKTLDLLHEYVSKNYPKFKSINKNEIRGHKHFEYNNNPQENVFTDKEFLGVYEEELIE